MLLFIKSGTKSARKLNRARILLLADDGKTDAEIVEALHTGPATVQRIRKRFVEGNLERALNEDPRPGAQRKLNEKAESVLEMLAHSKPPDGRKRWTLELLTERLVALKVVDSISLETVRQELKKTVSTWCEEKVVHSDHWRRVRVLYGGRAGCVRAALRPAMASGLL